MVINGAQALSSDLYWITLLAVIVSSASGVLKVEANKFDLFGVVIIGIATGLGGGSLRDMLLDRPVFWIHDQTFFIVSIASALLIFVIARSVKIPPRLFLIPDAAGLATFSIAGTLVALTLNVPWLVASFMGVMTAVMGGMFRDVLSNAPPIVFHSPLYATLSWLGSLGFIGLLSFGVDLTISAVVIGLSIFIARLLALYFDVSLPRYGRRSKP